MFFKLLKYFSKFYKSVFISATKNTVSGLQDASSKNCWNNE